MIFSSVIFLFLFLPITLFVYFFAGNKFRNVVLLTSSLLFYAWGEAEYVLLMLSSITLNWLLGLLLNKTKTKPVFSRFILIVGIIINLMPLLFFKYGHFIINNFNILLSKINVPQLSSETLHLPIGISFFTFQAISYLIDTYKLRENFQASPINLALYLSLFPQLIAGPIIRYHDIAKQIVQRNISINDLTNGIYRFVLGLAKKIFIANQMGIVADHIFSLSPDVMPAKLLWLGILAYTLQIYYDFSGYSDMAIGLGRLFGFHFQENFNNPYVSLSIQEFWRRWHISLSSWFRDYLYIPLGGNRKGSVRTYLNLMIVFFLCGLWHGASWTFAIWGMFHGFFIVLERTAFGSLLKKAPFLIRYSYAMIIVMIGWIFFRAETADHAINYLASLFIFNKPNYLDGPLFTSLNSEFYFCLIIGIFFATPLSTHFCKKYSSITNTALEIRLTSPQFTFYFVFAILTELTLIYGTAQIISGSYNPFLYFRF